VSAPARRIRVLHLIKGLNRGGAETLLSEGLRFADRSRFELSYAYFRASLNALVPALAEQGAPVTCFGGKGHATMLGRIRRIARHLRAEEIDLLHCHLPMAGVVGRLAGRLAGVPVLYTEHNKPEWYRRPTFLLNSWTYFLQDHVIAVSGSVEWSIRRYIRPTVPVTILRNGIDTNAFRRVVEGGQAVRRHYGIPADAPVVGNVAALIPQKQLHDWVEAARLVHQQHPDVRFLIVGEGPQHAELTALIDRCALTGIVHLCGVQSNVVPYLSAMDIYMMSSAFEGLPVALLEAMAANCAPVCTAVGGIPEVLEEGVDGFLAEPGHPDQLARKVAALVSDREQLTRVGLAAMCKVDRHFRVESMVASLQELYENVVRGARERKLQGIRG
jgi:L-malate glycosyltransferase